MTYLLACLLTYLRCLICIVIEIRHMVGIAIPSNAMKIRHSASCNYLPTRVHATCVLA